VIPLGDLDRRRGFPVVTAALVVVNALVWIYVLTLIDSPGGIDAFYQRWAFDPVAQLEAVRSGTPTFDGLAPWITHQFLHAGWLHVAGNMLFLWAFGGAVEDRLGRPLFLVFYLLAGIVAALTQGLFEIVVFHPTHRIHLVGASGAISGVLGAYLVLAPTTRVRALVPIGLFTTVVKLPAILLLGEWFVLQVVAAVNVLRLIEFADVAYFAHLGGFASGVVVTLLAKVAARIRRP